MSTTLLPRPEGVTELFPLEPGDHLDRATFHQRYLAMPKGVKAELINGVVYMPSPARRRHGSATLHAGSWLAEYMRCTPGVEAYDNASAFLTGASEVQPDLCLLISPESGGQTSVDSDYIVGAPELAIEVALSTASYDLHDKKDAYEKAGVREYLVVLTLQSRILWFTLLDGAYVEREPGDDSVIRSEVFPGLWLNCGAMLRLDGNALSASLQQGLATPEHAAFVERLRAAAGA